MALEKQTKSGLITPGNDQSQDNTEQVKSLLVAWTADVIRKSYNRKSKDPNSFALAANEIINRLIEERKKFEASGNEKELDVKLRGEAITQIDELARFFAPEIKNTYGLDAQQDTVVSVRTKCTLLGISYLQAIKNDREKNQPKAKAAARKSGGSGRGASAKNADSKKPRAKAKDETQKTKKAKGKDNNKTAKGSRGNSRR